MADNNQNVTIEGFVTDLAFDNRSGNIAGIFAADSGQVAALTAKVLSYFDTPAVFQDKRLPTARAVNWAATTSPRLVIDSTAFGTFVNTINNLSGSVPIGFFKILDKLFFNYQSSVTRTQLETYLTTDADTMGIYVANTFSVSSTLVSDTVYLDGGGTVSVQVPAFIDITVKLPTGQTTTNYVLRLFTSVDAWLAGYNVSHIVKVIPPLSYQQLYDASLTNSTDSIFSTATLTATLSYLSTQFLFGTISVSGTVEYRAVLTNGVDQVTVPFNILYKGRSPTLFEIRNAIKQALVDSGVGNEAGWRARIPGVYVTGRFYVIPLWDQTYTKPDQVIFPNIASYSSYALATGKILSSLGYGDSTSYMDVFSVFYNRMTATAVPDLSGTIPATHLSTLIPDYQDASPTEDQFGYMLANSQLFSHELNTVLAVSSGVQNSSVYTPIVEGQLTFYSFTVDSYEICVISKLCYITIMESTQ